MVDRSITSPYPKTQATYKPIIYYWCKLQTGPINSLFVNGKKETIILSSVMVANLLIDKNKTKITAAILLGIILSVVS
jgi:hypothetical protein